MREDRKRKVKKILVMVATIAIMCGFCYVKRNEMMRKEETMTYNEIIKALENGSLDKIEMKNMSNDITIVMKDSTTRKARVPDNSEFVKFVSQKVEEGSDVEIVIGKSIDLFKWLLPIANIILVSYVIIMFRNMQGKNFDVNSIKAIETFEDIAGIEEVQEQIEDIIDYLKDPKKFSEMGAKIPKGVLLIGEPGNGKTLLAKAMSGEAGVNFYQINGSSFEEKFVGVGASRVRTLFKKAKKNAPSIIFIDEIDSVACSRYSNDGNNNNQTLNQLLSEMDGFESNDNVIVIAATNHVEVLDDAILRPGRFDRRVYVPNPDVRAREVILELHAKDKPVSKEVSFKELAQKTIGFSGADLKNVLNEAAIYAVKKNLNKITNEAIDEAIATVVAGLKKKHSVMTAEDKHRTAIHEAAHAVVSAVVRPEVENFGISIVARGKTGGYNFFNEAEENYQKSKALLELIQVLYGGRAAEELILGDVSSGSSNDLEKASKIAFQMVAQYGMSDSLLVMIKDESEYNKLLGEKAFEEAKEICEQAYEKTKEVVKEYQIPIIKLATILEEKEYLTKEEIADFISDNFSL